MKGKASKMCKQCDKLFNELFDACVVVDACESFISHKGHCPEDPDNFFNLFYASARAEVERVKCIINKTPCYGDDDD